MAFQLTGAVSRTVPNVDPEDFITLIRNIVGNRDNEAPAGFEIGESIALAQISTIMNRIDAIESKLDMLETEFTLLTSPHTYLSEQNVTYDVNLDESNEHVVNIPWSCIIPTLPPGNVLDEVTSTIAFSITLVPPIWHTSNDATVYEGSMSFSMGSMVDGNWMEVFTRDSTGVAQVSVSLWLDPDQSPTRWDGRLTFEVPDQYGTVTDFTVSSWVTRYLSASNTGLTNPAPHESRHNRYTLGLKSFEKRDINLETINDPLTLGLETLYDLMTGRAAQLNPQLGQYISTIAAYAHTKSGQYNPALINELKTNATPVLSKAAEGVLSQVGGYLWENGFELVTSAFESLASWIF